MNAEIAGSSESVTMGLSGEASDHETVASLSVDVVESFEGGGLNEDTWNSIVSASNGTIYQTFQWQSIWWKHFGTTGRRSLHILVFRRNEEIVGIAPLFSEPGTHPRTHRLRLIGSGDAFSRTGGAQLDDGPGDYLDLVADPAHWDAIGAAFAAFVIERRSIIQSIDMVNLRATGPMMTAVYPRFIEAGMAVTKIPADRCPFIAIENNLDGYVSGLDAGVRRRMNQARRVLRGDPSCTLMSGSDAEQLEAFLPALQTLHQRRWNRAGFPGVFEDREHRMFQNEVAAAFFRKGWLWFAGILENKNYVAARLGFKFGGRIYDYLSGFDDDSPAAKKRPGLALLLQMYDDGFRSGIQELDLLRGDEKYKFELTESSHQLSNLRIQAGLPQTWNVRVSTDIGQVAEKIGFYLRRERLLLGVQARLHGWPGCILPYIRFRGKRLTGKILGHS